MATSVLEVIITGDASKLTVALNQGAVSAKTFEKQATSAGQTASKALGGLVVAGAAAAGFAVAAFAKQSVQSAIDFDRSMTQIAALTDTSSKRLGEMRQNVLSLAGETAQAPTDLANAMYFLASAGLSAAQQTDTLEASAKAAAVGLGQAGDIARITANALNVYGDNGLKAADVTDALVAAVREGSAEPDEFAGALGRVLPIADKAGISFQQVAASLATMSNAGLDVNEGVTALRGTLQALVAPTKQTSDALGSIGLTVDDVVNSLQGQGLIGTLRMLDDEAKRNTDSTGQYNILMRQLVPNVRALTGVFNLTAQQASKVDAIFKDVTHSSGDLEEAFVTTEQAASFRLHKALNDISIDGQELASKVLPDVASALGFVADHAKGLLEILTGFALVKFGSKLASAFNLTVDSLGPLSGLAKRAQDNIGGLGLVAVSVAGTFTVLKGVWDDAHIDLEKLATQTKISADELKFFRDQMDLAGSAFEGHSFEGFITSLNGVGANMDELLSKLTPVIQRLKDAGLTTGDWNTVIGQLQPLIDGTSGSIDRFVGEVTGAADTIRGLQSDFAHGKIDFQTFQQNLTAIGVSVPGTMVLADQSVDKFGKHVTKAGDVVRNFAGLTSEELDKMRQDYQKNFNIVGGVLDKFAGKMNLSADKVIAAFTKQLSAVHDYQHNLETVEKRNIPDDILKQITDMGLDGAGFMQLLANASKEQFHKIINQMEAGATAAEDVTSSILDIPKVHNTTIKVAGAQQSKADVDALGSSIQALPPSTVLDIKLHTHAGSPWPDEALKTHLTDPINRMGFKKIAGVWTLPLNVGAHTDAHGSLGGGGGGGGGGLGPLLAVEKDSRDYLKTIAKGSAVGGGGGAGGSSGSGSGGSTRPGAGDPLTQFGKQLGGALHNLERFVADQQGPKAAHTWATEIAKELNQPGTSKHETELLRQAWHDLRISTTAKEFNGAAKDFHDAVRHWEDAHRRDLTMGFRDEGFVDRLLKNAPRLPRGHTHIDNSLPTEPHLRQSMVVNLDRKRFVDATTQEVSYGRGY